MLYYVFSGHLPFTAYVPEIKFNNNNNNNIRFLYQTCGDAGDALGKECVKLGHYINHSQMVDSRRRPCCFITRNRGI